MWRFANRHRIVDTWPEVELEREPQRTPVAWTAAELSTLVATTKNLQGPVRFNDQSLPQINRCDWWTALILTAFDSGERITALLGVEWSDVDLDAGWILFRAEHRKGGRADNCLDVADDTIEALRRIQRPSGKVFPWDRGDLWMHFGAILEQAGLPYDRKRKFHCIRKSTASHLAAAGGDPGQMLTHSCKKVTQAYLDPRITGQRESIKRLTWRP
ncbi:MAG: site-specific integrase [Pirellulaceae bacterium]